MTTSNEPIKNIDPKSIGIAGLSTKQWKIIGVAAAIIHWANGGPTDTNNLIALCNKHHRTHHQGLLGITGNADNPTGVKFTNRHGQPIRASGARPQPPGEQSATKQAATPYRPALRERLESRWQHFNPPQGFRPYWDHDLGCTVNPRQHAS